MPDKLINLREPCKKHGKFAFICFGTTRYFDGRPPYDYFYAVCEHKERCKTRKFNTKKEAVAAWNKRAGEGK